MTSAAARDFGVQSFCFRHFSDNKDVADMVRAIGLSTIELCGVHADFDDLDDAKRITEIYQSAGVSIVSIGVQCFTGQSNEATWLDWAMAAGAKHVSAHFQVDTFTKAVPEIARMAADRGIKIGLHCHGGYMFGGSTDEIQHILDLGGDSVGLNLDTAWCMQIGPQSGRPAQWVREVFRDRIVGVHYKDFVFEPNGQWQDVVVGKGTLDLPDFVAALDETNFDGMAVIEYEGDVENPVPALTKCVEAMREVTG